MAQNLKDLKFSETHEWVRKDGDSYVIGITEYAAKQLGDVVFVELPEVGRAVKKGESFGVVESVKSVSDLISPVSGNVAAVNALLGTTPETVNASPYEDAWMIKVSSVNDAEIAQLLNEAQYEAFVKKENA